MKSVFDASFRYQPSFGTDVRKTFERIRRAQQAQSRGRGATGDGREATVKVVQLDQVKKGG